MLGAPEVRFIGGGGSRGREPVFDVLRVVPFDGVFVQELGVKLKDRGGVGRGVQGQAPVRDASQFAHHRRIQVDDRADVAARPRKPRGRRAAHFRLGADAFFPDAECLRATLEHSSPHAFRARRIYTVAEPLQRARFPREAARRRTRLVSIAA